MGTSSARRAPTGPRWRQAKRAAARYLAQEAGEGGRAAEVAARYVTALEETGGEGEAGFLASFRQTRKTAQDLGDFWRQVLIHGLTEALAARGLKGPAGTGPAALSLALAARLRGPADSLEAASDRAALAAVLSRPLAALLAAAGERRDAAFGRGALPEAAQLVGDFLTAALGQRLVLDLGETLEAAAGSRQAYRRGLAGLQAALASAAESPGATPEIWGGWEGWRWVTEYLETVRQVLAPPQAGGGD